MKKYVKPALTREGLAGKLHIAVQAWKFRRSIVYRQSLAVR